MRFCTWIESVVMKTMLRIGNMSLIHMYQFFLRKKFGFELGDSLLSPDMEYIYKAQ